MASAKAREVGAMKLTAHGLSAGRRQCDHTMPPRSRGQAASSLSGESWDGCLAGGGASAMCGQSSDDPGKRTQCPPPM
ncbi:hypothetical protein PSHT_08666 [Puccinia striiformis]|uniref:Uncharacterized protein n=1 Tax=Puccinia striiformis TaxID=27350 RepID=A0A2S4VMN4_9BASI|nr:hypothetical protein PSHT_08666 [Puccinia striiformis]